MLKKNGNNSVKSLPENAENESKKDNDKTDDVEEKPDKES
jgi:hypothetical protein